jgi:hypothetical protein
VALIAAAIVLVATAAFCGLRVFIALLDGVQNGALLGAEVVRRTDRLPFGLFNFLGNTITADSTTSSPRILVHSHCVKIRF